MSLRTPVPFRAYLLIQVVALYWSRNSNVARYFGHVVFKRGARILFPLVDQRTLVLCELLLGMPLDCWFLWRRSGWCSTHLLLCRQSWNSWIFPSSPYCCLGLAAVLALQMRASLCWLSLCQIPNRYVPRALMLRPNSHSSSLFAHGSEDPCRFVHMNSLIGLRWAVEAVCVRSLYNVSTA